jgi:hypothetical protein
MSDATKRDEKHGGAVEGPVKQSAVGPAPAAAPTTGRGADFEVAKCAKCGTRQNSMTILSDPINAACSHCGTVGLLVAIPIDQDPYDGPVDMSKMVARMALG